MRDLDACVRAAWSIFYQDVDATKADLIVTTLSADKARWLQSPTVLDEIASSLSTPAVPIILGGDMEYFLLFRRSIFEVFMDFDRLDAATGAADGDMTFDDLFVDGLALSNPPELDEAITFLRDNRARFEAYLTFRGYDLSVSKVALRDALLRRRRGPPSLDPSLGSPSTVLMPRGSMSRLDLGAWQGLLTSPVCPACHCPPAGADWAAASQGPDSGTYDGSSVPAWWDWEQRMWYLFNLFRALPADDAVAQAPNMASLDEVADPLSPSAREKLRVG